MWVLRLLRSHQVHQALEDRMYGHQRYETAHCVRELLYLGMAGPNGRGVWVCVCVCVCVCRREAKDLGERKHRQNRHP